MTFYFFEYISLFIYFVFSFFFGCLIFFLSAIFSENNSYFEKLSAYECGFDPFEDARQQFDVRFYLVAILFLIFDLEASFIFPWVINLGKLDFFSFWAIFDFLFELVVGFVYVWKIGALEW